MALLTPTQAKGENFVSGATAFLQSDNASDPATANPIEYSAAESDALKSLLKMLLNVASNSGVRYVENTTGSDIPAATLCYVSGYDETNGAFLVSPATPSHPPTLVTLADLPDTEFVVAYQANVSQANLNTSTASAVGVLVYLDPATPGAWTFAVNALPVGMVLVKDAVVGQISFNVGAQIPLPVSIANGGTNSHTALTNNQLMTSTAGKIAELGVMTNGQIVVGKTANAPQIVTPSGGATISNTGVITLTGSAVAAAVAAAAALSLTGAITTTNGIASGTAKVVGCLAYALAAAGAALTASNAETVLASYTIPANTILVGTVLRVRFQMIQTAVNGADTLQIRLRLGTTTLTGTLLITGTATAGAANNIASGEFVLTGRGAPGASAAIVGTGRYIELAQSSAGGATLDKILASTTFATNGALKLELTGQFSSTNAGNSCRADNFIVEVY